MLDQSVYQWSLACTDMTSMLEKIKIDLNLNPSDEQGRKLHAYALRLTETQRFWSAKNNLYVVGHERMSTYVVCERIISRTRTVVRCHRNGCMRESLVENIDKIEDIEPIKKKMCIHAQVCTLLFEPEGSDQTDEREHFVEVLDVKGKNNVVLSVVHPSIDKNKKAGLVCLTSSTDKPKCLSCEGLRCIHIGIDADKRKEKRSWKRWSSAENIEIQKNNIMLR